MGQKYQLFEDGYGKGWLYKDSKFIDFVLYHYQIFQLVSTNSIRPGRKTPNPKHRLSGNLKFVNYSGKISDEWYLLLVTKTKGFNIHLVQKEETPKTYQFVQEKGGEPVH